MSGIRSCRVSVDTVGAAGSATGSTVTPGMINGEIVKIVLDYHAGNHANTVLLISAATATYQQTVAEIVYVKAANKTDAVIYPRAAGVTNAGVALGAGSNPYEYFTVHGYLTVLLASTNALTAALVADIYWISDD